MNMTRPITTSARHRPRCTCKQRAIGDALGLPEADVLAHLAARRWHPDGTPREKFEDIWRELTQEYGVQVSTGWLSTQLNLLRPTHPQQPAA
jgi:hypothetical protein